MRIDNPSISGSLSFIGGTNSISATSVSLTGSLSGTFEGAFSGDSLTNISGAFDSVSASLASERLKNTSDTLTGDLTVTGKITAQEFHTEFVSASIIYESGSTQFGNSSDDVHTFTGNVGIGTISPDYKLEVESTSDADLVSIKSTAGANNTQMRLGISGNDSVISGTGGSSGNLVLKTYGSERLRIDTTGVTSIYNGTLNLGTDSVASVINSIGDLFIFNVDSNNNTGGTPNFRFRIGSTTDIATIDGTGVGIGTVSPSEKLHIVNGRINFDKENTASGGDYDFIKIGYNGSWSQNDNGLAAIEVNDGGGTVGKFGISYAGGSGGYFVVKSLYNGSGYGGSGEVFKVNGFGLGYFSGKLGIGTSPSVNLHVNQPNHNEDTAGYANSTTLWRLRNETVSGNPTGRFTLYNSGNATINIEGSDGRVTYFNAGNVGIGETTPGHKLDIKGSDAYLVNINNTATDARLQFERNGTAYGHMSAGADLFTMYGNPGTSLRFMPGGSTAMFIKAADGNVGIGTTDPQYKLQVQGTLFAGVSTFNSTFQNAYTNDGLYNANAFPSKVLTPSGQQIIFGYFDNGAGGYFPRIGLRQDYDAVGSPNTTTAHTSLGLEQDGRLNFKVGASNAVEALTIKPDGNIGIGATNPTSALHINGASAHIQFTGTNNRITFSGYRAVEGSHDGATLQLGEGYSKTVMYGNVGIGINSPTHTLEVNGPTKSSYFTSNVNTTKSGLGPRDWTLIGPEDGSASRAAALQIGDVSGAKYAIAGGDYDLSFYKHVSSPDSYTRAFYISGVSAVDDSPNFVVDNKLYNNGKYYYSDGGLLLKKMVTCGDNTTTTLLTIDSNGSYSCIGGGELLVVFVDVGSPWGVYVWKGLLTMRTVQFGSMYSSGIQMTDERNNLDGTFTVSSSTSKTGGVADGKLIVTATTSSGIAGTAHVSFNGWTTGGAQPY